MVPGRHLGNQHGGGHRVLVADIVADHVAVAFLEGEDVLIAAGGLPGGNALGHELEAGEGVLKMHAVCLGNGTGHLGRDQTAHGAGRGRHGAGRLSGLNDIVQKEDAHLVSGDGDILAVFVTNHGSDAVRVRVGTDDQVAVDLLGKIDAQIEALRVLGVGALHRGEAAVQHHLLLDGVDVLHAQALQSLGHQFIAAAVEGSVDDAELVRNRPDCLRIDGLAHDLLKEGLVRLDPDDGDLPVLDGFGIVAGLVAGENIRLGHPRCDGVGIDAHAAPAVGVASALSADFHLIHRHR